MSSARLFLVLVVKPEGYPSAPREGDDLVELPLARPRTQRSIDKMLRKGFTVRKFLVEFTGGNAR